MSHRPRKRFGQHFLHDPAIIDRIVAAIAPAPDDRLIEIGPGLGALTGPLLERVNRLTVIEIDRDAAAQLRATLGNHEGLKIIEGDALKTNYRLLAQDGPLRLVGNLPYNISTPLLFHLLAQIDCIRDLHFMLQKEVVQRMAAAPGSKTYGRLTVMLALRCKVEPLFDIGAGAFRPPPRVVSSFVRLIPDLALWQQLESEQVFEQLVRRTFSARRKTLRRSLKGSAGPAEFSAAGIDPGERPEQLSPEKFVALANACARGHETPLL